MSQPLVRGQMYRHPTDEFTWAGECRWTGNLCAGTENGRIVFYAGIVDGSSDEWSEELAEEAINGADFFGEYLGLSTRSEILLYRRSPQGKLDLVVSGDRGAHGILATPRGQFIAPMGPEGLFCIDALKFGSPKCSIDCVQDTKFNFYSLTYLARSGQADLLASAARTDGLLAIAFDESGDHNPVFGLTSPEIDFIDVCSLKSPQWPFAVVGLCLDRSLVFIRDIRSELQPQKLRFDEFRGTPYTILSAQGHVFVLTRREAFVLPDLASRYLQEEQLDQPVQGRHLDIDAVDAFTAYEKYLLIITDDGVGQCDIKQLVQDYDKSVVPNEGELRAKWDDLVATPSLVATPWESRVA